MLRPRRSVIGLALLLLIESCVGSSLAGVESSAWRQQGVCREPALFEYSPEAGRCCSKCSPGQGLTKPCDATNDTWCHACKLGVTYSPRQTPLVHHLQHCSACSPSPENAVVLGRCNLTHDTQWECKRGFYYNDTRRSCVPCRSCAEGWGKLTACTSSSDAVCIKCPDGTYSSGGDSCVVCTKCNPSQLTVHDCTSTQDTTCYDVKKHAKASETGTHQRISSEDRPTISPAAVAAASEFPTVPLYCAILGTVVVGLLLYVVVRCRPARAKKQQDHSKQPLKKDLVALLNTTGQQASTAAHRDVHFSEIPISTRKELAALLHRHDISKEHNWQGLARHLGFSPLHITDIAEQAEREGCTAAHSMLEDWCKRSGSSATVNALIHLLRRIGRTDAVLHLVKVPASLGKLA